jgi:hypothetical protein
LLDALVRVAKAGSLSYSFPRVSIAEPRNPLLNTGSIAHPLYSTTLEIRSSLRSYFLLIDMFLPCFSCDASFTDCKRQLVKRHLYGLTDTVELLF